ncbi:MAG: phage holin family protein [Bacteroidia bacterium]
MSEKNKTEELTEGLKNYLNTNSELLKLEATQQSSIIGSVIISGLIIGLFATLFVFFISMWAGFYLSVLLNSNCKGFAIVAGFYFLLMFIMVIGRKKLIETPIRVFLIKKLFGKK